LFGAFADCKLSVVEVFAFGAANNLDTGKLGIFQKIASGLQGVHYAHSFAQFIFTRLLDMSHHNEGLRTGASGLRQAHSRKAENEQCAARQHDDPLARKYIEIRLLQAVGGQPVYDLSIG